VYPLAAAMPKVATAVELLDLARDLSALKAELTLCATVTDVDMLVDRYWEMGVFSRLKPGGRQLLTRIIGSRLAQVEAAEEGAR
jgi:hypothetical protein